MSELWCSADTDQYGEALEELQASVGPGGGAAPLTRDYGCGWMDGKGEDPFRGWEEGPGLGGEVGVGWGVRNGVRRGGREGTGWGKG